MPDMINSEKYYEIGYILKKEHWHKGYAKECAEALAHFAFNHLNLDEVVFEIRPNNLSSIRIAESVGAKLTGKFIKTVKDKKMLHSIYTLYK